MTDPMQRAPLIDRLRVAINLGRKTGAAGKAPTNIYVLAEEALQALTREEEVGWQDIETAPKDAALIDLWWDGIRLVDCWWQNENEHFPNRPLGWICSKNAGHPFALAELNAKPTHWMLPAPPAIRGRAAGGGDSHSERDGV